MPLKSRWNITIPEVSLHTWVFQSADGPISDRKQLIDADRPDTHYLTMSSWRLWSKRVAVGLQKAGLKPGDRVLLFSGNNLFFPVVFMGIMMAGGIFTGANPSYVARELAHQLKDSGATFLLCADGSLEVGLEAASAAGMSKSQVFVFDDTAFEGTGKGRLGVRHWTELLASVEQGDRFVWKDYPPKETTCCLNYSSGTTGVPKGVEITHFNYVANGFQVISVAELNPDSEELLKTANYLCFLPMYHAMAQAIFITIAPVRGLPVYIMPKFDFVKMLENLEKFKISDLVVVPPIAVALAKSPLTKKYDLSSIRTLGCGAAPLSRAASEEAEAIWGGKVNMKQGWGMSEVTCSLLYWDPRDHSDSASVGELAGNCEAKVMNEAGTAEVPHGERGELYVKGPNVMKGYWRNPKATAETMTADGWLKTGDVCFVDSANRFHIVDRRKELIKVKGNQVAPAELEALLLEHPLVADSAVVGVTIGGEEVPRAYVVLREGAKVQEAEIAKWLESRVSRHKRLLGGVCFISAIPKNPSGKILRRLLRDQAKAEVGDADPKDSRL